MKAKLIYFLFFTGLFFSCSDTKNKKNEEEFKKATTNSENNKNKISELPLGFNFGMTNDEVIKQIKKLEQNKTITYIGNEEIEYPYVTKKGIKVDYLIDFSFNENELYIVRFSVIGDTVGISEAIIEDLNSKLDSTYLRSGYWEELSGSRLTFNNWIKGNQVIFLRNAIGLDLNYINAPVNKIVTDNKANQLINDAKKRLEYGDVKNSSWDGSVAQVKNYLKSNLKDPESYESIEWSAVSQTSNGYVVQHKYRAKNSFEGSVIENKIFYLDKKGTVIKSSDLK